MRSLHYLEYEIQEKLELIDDPNTSYKMKALLKKLVVIIVIPYSTDLVTLGQMTKWTYDFAIL